MNCKYYTEDEIAKDFPLEKCGTCENNKQDSEDGLYTCELVIRRVYQKSGTKGGEIK